MNSVIQVFILSMLPSIVASCFYIMMHHENDSKAITVVESVLCGLAFASIYIIELALACIS